MLSVIPREVYTSRGIETGRPYDVVDLESQALGLRRVLGYHVHEVINGLEFSKRIRECCVDVADKSHRICLRLRLLPEGMSALATFKSESDGYVIFLTEETCQFLKTGQPRGTWTIVHEAGGHLALHARLLQNLRRMPIESKVAVRRGPPHDVFRDSEWQADKFTAAFLMPGQTILKLKREHGSPLRQMGEIIQEYFHVSAEAAAYRWEDYHFRSGRLVNARPASISWSRYDDDSYHHVRESGSNDEAAQKGVS
jgi:hypothetical protein